MVSFPRDLFLDLIWFGFRSNSSTDLTIYPLVTGPVHSCAISTPRRSHKLYNTSVSDPRYECTRVSHVRYERTHHNIM